MPRVWERSGMAAQVHVRRIRHVQEALGLAAQLVEEAVRKRQLLSANGKTETGHAT